LTDRIARLAFEHARKNKKTRITCVTKANVVKTTDGRFLEIFTAWPKNILKSRLMTGTLTL